MKSPLLEARSLCKSFGNNVVLRDISLEVRAGEVHAFVGENGAGKSTLIKILGGAHKPDSGEIVIQSESRRFAAPRDAQLAGIVVIHQEFSLARDLSCEENIFLGHFPMTRLGSVDRREMRRQTNELFQRLSINIDPGREVGELSIAEQQMVEIAKALSFNCKVLILDEPTAVLDKDRVTTLFGVIRRLRDEGIGIVYVSHHLEELFEIANRVTVLRDGGCTGSAEISQIDQKWLVDHMIGRDFPARTEQTRNSGKAVLELDGLSVPGKFEDISFSVCEGEIVGLAGLVGAGRSEVAQTIVGLHQPSAGRIRMHGREVRVSGPQAAAKLGIAYLTEDRKAFGLLGNRPVRENLTIANLSSIGRFGWLNKSKETELVGSLVRRLDIRLSSVNIEISSLSGGNQQKALIGRALALEPKLLILDEPTRGVDIGAKEEIYRVIEALLAQGVAIIVISSEMEEVIRLSDRVVVLRRGRVATALPRNELTETNIMGAAALAK